MCWLCFREVHLKNFLCPPNVTSDTGFPSSVVNQLFMSFWEPVNLYLLYLFFYPLHTLPLSFFIFSFLLQKGLPLSKHVRNLVEMSLLVRGQWVPERLALCCAAMPLNVIQSINVKKVLFDPSFFIIWWHIK